MKDWSLISRRAAALVLTAAAACFATSARTGGVPKEGAFVHNVAATGTVLQTNPIGKYGDAVYVYEENGTVEGSADGPHKSHCVIFVPFVKNTVLKSHGYCIETDQDGDQILSTTTSGTRPLSAEGRTLREVTMGTGKYAGMMSSSAVTCQFSGGMEQYSVNCEERGSYKIPGG